MKGKKEERVNREEKGGDKWVRKKKGKLFADEVESCQKLHQFLDVFDLPNFRGVVPPKTCTLVITHT